MAESKYIKKVGDGINFETDGDGGGAGGAEIKTFETTATLAVVMGIGSATITLPDTIEVNKILSIEMQMENVIEPGTFIGYQLPYCDVDANEGVFSIKNYMSFDYIFEKEPFNIQEIRLKVFGQDFTNNMTLPLVISYV